MGKKMIYILIVLMSVVLSLLVFVQMNIISKAANIKEEQFNQLVKRCLIQVATQLQEEETFRFINAEKQRALYETGIISQYKINFSFNLQKDQYGNIRTSSSIHESDTIITPTQNQEAFKALEELNRLKQEQFRQSLEERDQYTRHIQYQLELANTPIEERVNREQLATLLKNELQSNGINLDYEYVIKSYPQGNEKIIIKSENYKNNSKKEHQTPLFTKDIGSQKPNYLKIYFPREQSQFIKETGIMVVPTALLLILIIGIFTYTIFIILKQKKLSMVKNDFINNMTHELKTPISTISLASQMLRDNTVHSSPSTIERITGVIFDESKRLSNQVEKVLQMAVFNEGRLKLKFKNFDLSEVVTSVVQNFEIRVQSANGIIKLENIASQSIIYGDQVHITNVLFNLLDNAVKYSKEAPVIEVKVYNKKDIVAISVQDNGIGIAKEHQKQIFERFYRVPTGNVHDVKGFGLGLHYVAKIIEIHKGAIKVDSSPNKGTIFKMYFPIKE